MSSIVKFFVAPDDASAALVVETGPGHAFETLSFGNFDSEEAVVEWECLLSGGDFEQLVEAGEPRVVAGEDDDGCVVFALSARLTGALAEAERFRLREVAEAWARQRAEDGAAIDTELAGEMVESLGTLARGTEERGHGLYCWLA
ncbi:hypothetical protein [Streptomyces sp. NPDC059466]|uniref:hypothetical protein n=1 Tax=unclassified Streptomyces TaxID=2593676 RepID=UPI00367F856C